MRQSRTFLQAFLHNRLGMVGLVGVLLVVIMGLFAPLIAAYPDGYGTEILLAPSASCSGSAVEASSFSWIAWHRSLRAACCW